MDTEEKLKLSDIEFDQIYSRWTRERKLFLGGHAGSENNLLVTFCNILNSHRNAVQLSIPSSHYMTPEDVIQESIIVKKIIQQQELPIFNHADVCHNMSSSVKGPNDWSYRKRKEKIIEEVAADMDFMHLIGGKGVVIHFGRCTDKDWGWYQMIDNIELSLESTSIFSPYLMANEGYSYMKKRVIILENSAMNGNSLGENNIEAMKKVRDSLKPELRSQLKFCIDTCHLWDEGKVDVSNVENLKNFFTIFDEKLGLKNLALIHLNDSKNEKGSRKDRHHTIGFGKIWGENVDSLKWLLHFCEKNTIPLVLETPLEADGCFIPKDLEIIGLAGIHYGYDVDKCRAVYHTL